MVSQMDAVEYEQEFVTAVCQCCGKALDVKHQPRLRAGDTRPPLLQLECKQDDCLLFEKTAFVASYADYLATDYVAKWTIAS